jgi:hypothetical protein
LPRCPKVLLSLPQLSFKPCQILLSFKPKEKEQQ